jgi:iron(III) transport system ATP-binding protein
MAPPEEIYNRPSDLFVANFTGASNTLPGRVVSRNGKFGSVETPSGQHLTALLPSAVADGEAVKIALRPENVQLGVDASAGANRFTARVAAQRYQGTQTIYELAMLGGQIEALELGTSARFAIGSEIEVMLPPALCWAYPARETVEAE